MFENKKPIDKIIKSLRDKPEEWYFDGYCLVKRSSGLGIWIANGKTFLSIYNRGASGDGPAFNFIEKMRLWSAVRYCLQSLVLHEQ